MHHNNSLKDIITSLITDKHIKQHMRHIGDLVVEHLSHPLMFDFQSLQHFRPTGTVNLDYICKVLPKIFLSTLLKCSQSFLLLATIILAMLQNCTL